MPVSKPATKGSRAEADERFLVQAAQKDPSRLAELYELHFDAVYAFIARRIHARYVAEDLTSDVFHKALTALPRFDWRGVPFGVWLFRIASNVVTDQWKRSAKVAPVDPPEPANRAGFRGSSPPCPLVSLGGAPPARSAPCHSDAFCGR
jgi:RNA polymerase sigma-70 factor, ECF subfamily